MIESAVCIVRMNARSAADMSIVPMDARVTESAVDRLTCSVHGDTAPSAGKIFRSKYC